MRYFIHFDPSKPATRFSKAGYKSFIRRQSTSCYHVGTFIAADGVTEKHLHRKGDALKREVPHAS